MSDPFAIPGPACVSFSGGRTSGYMLWRILQAHGGTLPPDLHVIFANTGKERPETLAFVGACARAWGVPIAWVEWRAGGAGFEVVGENSASRNGEPFAALIAMKNRLPNWKERWCTQFLKVETMTRYARTLGLTPGKHLEVIGLRRDEPWRYAKMVGRNVDDGRQCVAPLYTAGITKAEVMAFWAAQPFDLGLQPWEGNCDFCFLKGRGLRKRIARDHPEIPEWWAAQESTERGSGKLGWFDRRDRVAALVEECRQAPELWDFDPDEEAGDECGLYCGPAGSDEAAA